LVVYRETIKKEIPGQLHLYYTGRIALRHQRYRKLDSEC